MIDKRDITGLVLAGGRGARMGGLDKGLQQWAGQSLALRAAERLAPQVGALAINANRNLDTYASFAPEVWPDADGSDFPGPLAGFASGLAKCSTPYLATVPCDAPFFPPDLVSRLASALEVSGAGIATVHTMAAASAPQEVAGMRSQPVFCLMRKTALASLDQYMNNGGRKIDDWLRRENAAAVVFEDAFAFTNVNTTAELRRLQS